MNTILEIKQWYWRQLAVFGEPICPICGSYNIIKRGFVGVNRRHDCQDCNIETPMD